ncbi:hypothetical protein CEUSTIGMA_g228.t1 [Chlamydomonas eustigma]|uniref:ARID domain-containing protein n=1 Tax=Chlamydomonas eustigma TaxID=1157962 RepID=A0A250WQ37_9CHLO|nr:hypothetical protein CEUSTIGMA_g228.t1 [Chlamydomonas eustigma]|eukprot:GAX72772.1 hypothetical protein CEUSTIGMA_g228.t1 [Chlamydomonas eustigma]
MELSENIVIEPVSCSAPSTPPQSVLAAECDPVQQAVIQLESLTSKLVPEKCIRDVKPLKPFSADDVNPVTLISQVTTWLPPPTQSNKPSFDLRNMNRAQIAATARRHNSALNILDPTGEILESIRERAKINDPARVVYPMSLGGNTMKDEYSKAWKSLSRGGLRVKIAPPEKPAFEKEVVPAAAPEYSVQAVTGHKQPEASSFKPQMTAGPLKHSAEQLRKVAFGQPTVEQQRFNTSLSAFLGISVKLPLLSPGAMVLDLKRLFTEVSAVGGFRAACETDSWSHLAASLQNDSSLATILKKVYLYYLIPLEEIVPRDKDPRQARLIELMESKGKEREPCRSILPPADKVKASMKAAAEALVDTDCRLPASRQPRLAVNLLRHISRHVVQSAALDGLLGEWAVQNPRGISFPDTALQGVKVTGMNESDPPAEAIFGEERDHFQGPERPGLAGVEEEAVQATNTTADIYESGRSDACEAEPAAEQLGWNEVVPLELLLLSYRQLQAGPRVLRGPAPDLKAHYLLQLKNVAGSSGLNLEDEKEAEASVAISKLQGGYSYPKVHRVLPPGRKRVFKGTTPKCGNCRSCNNPSLKKACFTNRELIEQGKEPIFLTKEAKAVYLSKIGS